MAGEDIPLSPLTGRPTRPLPRGPLGAPQQPQQPLPLPQPQPPLPPQPPFPLPPRPPSGRLPQPGASLFLDSDQQGRAPIPPTEPVPPPGVTRSVADDSSEIGAPSGPILGIVNGRYELEAKLGEGGMGTVYRCFDRHLKRRAALKQILPDKLRPDRVTRFLHEAHAMARLQHPGCVAVYDVGVAADGAPYMVMELVQGEPLIDIVERGHIAPGRTALWLHQVAGALHCVHQEGIVHRDVKPHNILICASGAKLADFGIAKDEEATTHVTKVGHLIGTIAYMPPEQTGVGGATVDPRTDVYALGATLYHCLVGKTPFSGPREVLIRAVLEVAPTPPRALDPEIPRDLEAIALKCLEKEREDRYQSALELQEDLGRYLAGEPVLARNPSWLELGWAWVRRHRKAVLAGLVVGLAVAGGFGAFIGAGVLRDRAAAKAALEQGEELFAKAKYDEAEAQFAEAARFDTPFAGQGREGVLRARAWKSALEGEDALQDFRVAIASEVKCREILATAPMTALDPEPFATSAAKKLRAAAEQELNAARTDRTRAETHLQLSFRRAFDLYPDTRIADRYFRCASGMYEALVELDIATAERVANEAENFAQLHKTHSPLRHSVVRCDSRPSGAEVSIFKYEFDATTGTERPGPFSLGTKTRGAPAEPTESTFFPLRDDGNNSGVTPVERLELPPGEYLFVFRKNGFFEARQPFVIPRGRDISVKVDLVPLDVVDCPERFRHVPRGPIYVNHFVEQAESDFLLEEREVTLADWQTFWRASGQRNDLLPQGPEPLEFMAREAALPARRVSLRQALEYVHWFGDRFVKSTDWQCSLPTSQEYFRALKGPLPRVFAWGNVFDYTFAGLARTVTNDGGSRDWKQDESPFGCKDLSGSVSELCENGDPERSIVYLFGASIIDSEPQARAKLDGQIQGACVTNAAFDYVGLRVAIRRKRVH